WAVCKAHDLLRFWVKATSKKGSGFVFESSSRAARSLLWWKSMKRRLVRGFVLAALAVGHLSATGPASSSSAPPALQRFLSLTDPAAVSHRALRRLDAQCEGLGKSAWMDVWTELDERGALHYQIAA